MGRWTEVSFQSGSPASIISSQMSPKDSFCTAGALSEKTIHFMCETFDTKCILHSVIDEGVHKFEEADTKPFYLIGRADLFPARQA